MLSRVADSLYWMSRNIERRESNARILSVQLIHILEASEEETLANHDWEMVVEICASYLDQTNIKKNEQLDEELILNYVSYSKDNPNSIVNCINIARENARITRDHLPNDFWEIWNDFYLSVDGLREGKLSKRDIHNYLNRIKLATLTAQGAIESSMSRGEAYRFIKIGKWLERAENTARILNVVCNHSKEEGEEFRSNYYYNWRTALQFLNGYDAYLKQYPPTMDPKLVLSFLIGDRTFPRSIRYCIDHVREAVQEIEHGKVSHYSKQIFQLLDDLSEEFNEMKIKELNLDELSDYLDHFQNRCNEVGKVFSETYYLIEPSTTDSNSGEHTSKFKTPVESRGHMKFQIEHINKFYYETAVDQSMNTVRLKPSTDECQRLLSYRTEINPSSLPKEHFDIWGNTVEEFYIPEKHTHLEVKTTSIVSVQRSPYINQIIYSTEMREIFNSQLFREHYLSYLNETQYTFMRADQIQQVTDVVGEMSNPILFSINVMKYLHDTIGYKANTTNVETKAQESFDLKNGVCQDITHVMLGILRAKNIPARYVSGYLYIGEGSAFVGDSATHAWVEVMLPGIGWVGLDPTNNVEALKNHIRIGTGRDYADVSPVQGVYRGGKHKMDVSISVTLLE